MEVAKMFGAIYDTFHRFTDDMAHVATSAFAAVCRGTNAVAFTRERKLPLVDLIHAILCRKGRSLALELREFMAHFRPGQDLSKPGYLKRRMLLSPEAFRFLARNHNRNFYADGVGHTFHGRLVLAVDGSNVLIPSTQENIETYGTSGRKGNKPQAALGLSCVHDVLNRMIVDAEVFRSNFDERAAARMQLARVRDAIGNCPFIAVMDRGYSSLPLFLWLIQQGIPFVARLRSTDFQDEQSRMEGDDCDMEIPFTPQRIANHSGTPDGDAMARAGRIPLRLVRIQLGNGSEEILATTLPRDEFNKEQVAGCMGFAGAGFDVLKNCLQMENFTGTKPRLLLQDIYATIYVSNVASDIALEADRELAAEESKRAKPRKHPVAINRSYLIGALKNDMILCLLVNDPKKREAMLMKLYKDILKHVEPVRPGRVYPRRKGKFASKHSMTHKRLF